MAVCQESVGNSSPFGRGRGEGLATKTQKYFFLPFYRSGQERVEESFLFSLLSYALTPTLSPKGRGGLPTNSWRTVLMVVSSQVLLACGLFDELFFPSGLTTHTIGTASIDIRHKRIPGTPEIFIKTS